MGLTNYYNNPHKLTVISNVSSSVKVVDRYKAEDCACCVNCKDEWQLAGERILGWRRGRGKDGWSILYNAWLSDFKRRDQNLNWIYNEYKKKRER